MEMKLPFVNTVEMNAPFIMLATCRLAFNVPIVWVKMFLDLNALSRYRKMDVAKGQRRKRVFNQSTRKSMIFLVIHKKDP